MCDEPTEPIKTNYYQNNKEKIKAQAKLWRQNKNYLGEGRFEYKDNLSS